MRSGIALLSAVLVVALPACGDRRAPVAGSAPSEPAGTKSALDEEAHVVTS